VTFVTLTNRVQRWLRGAPVTLLYHPDYRLPLTSLQAKTGMDPRRADLVVDFLLDAGVVGSTQLVEPRRARYLDLARAHTEEYLESVFEAETLAHILAVDTSELPVDETLRTFRLACGGTLEAARIALDTGRPALNLLGGFHHAGRARGGGFSVFNDVAVAVLGLRSTGFSERVLVLDLDAHPPDGIAECLLQTRDMWIGSLSGASWGTLERTDETVLSKDCSDAQYLEALRGLLTRMPKGGIAFVVAGGDVLALDAMGGLGLTLAGARQRDLLVAAALRRTPSVWVPAGGYTPDAWRLLAGTVLAVAFGSAQPIPHGYDALRTRFHRIAEDVGPEALTQLPQLEQRRVSRNVARQQQRAPVLPGRWSSLGRALTTRGTHPSEDRSMNRTGALDGKGNNRPRSRDARKGSGPGRVFESAAAPGPERCPRHRNGDWGMTEVDLMIALGQGGQRCGRVLGFYTAEGIEYGLHRYGVLSHLRRLGFDEFRVALDRDARGDRVRLFGTGRCGEQLLVDCVVERTDIASEKVLFVHWLSLQNPAGHFSEAHPRLPGQQAPGLGLAREAGELFAQVTRRLGLAGFAFTPAWFHTAHAAKGSMCFADPARQGEFEALVELLAPLPLPEATRAVAEGRVLLNGVAYSWQPGVMVRWLDGRSMDRERVAEARAHAKFALLAR
jgi:acetoin utilization deacetylase AcuC-like enzyme